MMDRQIRRVGFVLLAVFLLVFARLNWIQVFNAESLAAHPSNSRALLLEYSIKRGDIVTSDYERVAVSEKTPGRLKYQRVYPSGELYGHITGYYSLVYGTDRVERTYHEQLLGDSGVISMQDIQDSFLGSGDRGDDIRLTVNSRLQEKAREVLGGNRGAIVAIDPTNGDVRALWSNPSFDPNPLASHEPDEIRAAWNDLKSQTPNPLINLATASGFPPGSTFKVVTAAAAIESGKYDRGSTFPDPQQLTIPQTPETLTNFTKQTCAGGGQIDLFDALVVSCDTTFAILGMRIHNEIVEMAEAMGFNDSIPFDLSTEASGFPQIDDDNIPFRAYGGIGQGDVVATPFQMALVAATVANGGEVPRPRVVRQVLDPSGGIVTSIPTETLGRAMSESTAATLTDMMTAVVEVGTGANAQIEGVPVAGKTGTAQSTPGAAPHAWFIAFAPADDPQLAVCVLVLNGGSFGAEATGGTVAAPMAKAIFETDRETRGW